MDNDLQLRETTLSSPFLDFAEPAQGAPPESPAAPLGGDGPVTGSGGAADLDYAAHYVDDEPTEPMIQLRTSAGGSAGGDIFAAAEHGLAAPSVALPYADEIQRSFGAGVDLGHIQAHVGGAASEACDDMGADAYAQGTHVAFADTPDLHTAAHEAAHVIQQAQGVSLYGGVGAVGDAYEQHADAVADRVVAGESAADLLGAGVGALAGGGAVQRKETHKQTPVNPKMTALHEVAETRSGQALDDDFKIIARKLNDVSPKIQPTVEVLDRWDALIADQTAKVARAEGQERNKLKRELLETKWERDYSIMKIADPILGRALSAATKELNNLHHKAASMGVTDEDEIGTGVNYVRAVVDRLHGYAERMGVSVLMQPIEKLLNDIFTKFKIQRFGVGHPDNFDDVDTLKQDAIAHHLDAAVAQAQYMSRAIDYWTAPGTKAEGTFNEIGDSVEAIDTHLVDATELLKQIDPKERKKFASRVAQVKRDVGFVYAKGKMGSRGRSPVGSHSMDIDGFDIRLANLQAAMSTTPASASAAK